MALTGKLIDGATTTGPGSPVQFDVPKSQFAIQVIWTGGDGGPGVALECSMDGAHWFELVSRAFGTVGFIQQSTVTPPVPAPMIRANITSINGHTVTVYFAAS